MRGTLQYLYSIAVFVGVLLSSYMMLSRDGASRLPLQIFQGSVSASSQASVVDPGVDQLFEFEEALSTLDENGKSGERVPTGSESPVHPSRR